MYTCMDFLMIFSGVGIIVLIGFIIMEENLYPKIKHWIHSTTKSKNDIILDKMAEDLFKGKINTVDVINEIKRQIQENAKERKRQEQKEKNEIRKQKINNLNNKI